MQTIHRAPTKGLALAAVLAFGVCVPMTVYAQEHSRDADMVVATMAQDEPCATLSGRLTQIPMTRAA